MWEEMSGLDITIAVAMHKQYARTEDTVYLPVHVGAALYPEVFVIIHMTYCHKLSLQVAVELCNTCYNSSRFMLKRASRKFLSVMPQYYVEFLC